jgi:hypothetical protein
VATAQAGHGRECARRCALASRRWHRSRVTRCGPKTPSVRGFLFAGGLGKQRLWASRRSSRSGSMARWFRGTARRITCSRTRCTTASACSRASAPTSGSARTGGLPAAGTPRAAAATRRRMLRIEVPFARRSSCVDGCCEVMAKNGLREGYLRPLVFVDDGRARARCPQRTASASPWRPGRVGPLPRRRRRAPRHPCPWCRFSLVRMSARSFLPKGKICGQYVNSVLAKRGAAAAGFDEAILLDEQGFVAEATGENLFLVRDGALVTPPTLVADPRRHHARHRHHPGQGARPRGARSSASRATSCCSPTRCS